MKCVSMKEFRASEESRLGCVSVPYLLKTGFYKGTILSAYANKRVVFVFIINNLPPRRTPIYKYGASIKELGGAEYARRYRQMKLCSKQQPRKDT